MASLNFETTETGAIIKFAHSSSLFFPKPLQPPNPYPLPQQSDEGNLENSTCTTLMSALGHKQTCAAQKGMSALPPKADMCGATKDVRFGPLADSCGAAEGIDRGQFHSGGTRTH